jgi:hypothetical protein
MRSSQDTERTQVPTRVNSDLNLAAGLKRENMSTSTLASGAEGPTEHGERMHLQYEGTNPNIVENEIGWSGNTTEDEKDVEQGNVAEDTKKAEHKVEEHDPNVVVWDGPDDPGNPMNWSRNYRWAITIVMGVMTFCITFASSVFSTATTATAIKFGVSTEVMTLGTSLFVLVSSGAFHVGSLANILGFRCWASHLGSWK